MKVTTRSIITAGMLLASCSAAMAMKPVQTKDGLAAGIQAGYAFGQFPGNFAAAGDIEYGFHNPIPSLPGNAAVVLDGLFDFGSGFKQNLSTLGVMLPVGGSGSLSYAVEGGFARAYTYVRGFGSSTDSGAMLGGRVTFAQSGDMTFNAMARYYLVSSSGWQAGIGVSRPMGPVNLQVDYYRVHSNAAGSVDSNYILVGARFGFGG